MKLDHTYENVVKDLEEAYGADHDGREKAREADHFVNKSDGQWEPEIIRMYDNKPRYTIDLTSGIIADAHGEMSSMDFTIKVRPAGGPSTNKVAMHLDGLIRNIENNSIPSAKYTYRAAGKQMLTTGIGGWEVVQAYRDPLSFDQDLMIQPISNFMDRVWLDPGAELQDASDADFGFKLTSLSEKQYIRDWPKGGKMGIAFDRASNVYSYKKAGAITVAAHYYKRFQTVELVRMSNGSVYEVDDDFNTIKDELSAAGVEVERSRMTKAVKVYQRMFDGSDFLNDAEETVFTYIPLVPVYGNFEISEDKVIYWGIVEKHKDPQRILNYVESRKVAEGALAPRAKKWATPQQVAGFETSFETMNTNDEPVQMYNFIDGQTPPFETGGAQINPGLSEASQDMKAYMQSISGRLDPARSEPLGLQSGLALQQLNNKSDVANFSYFTAMEVAIAHTCRIIGDAIPRVYDSQREVQLDFQDGTNDTITLNQRILDRQTNAVVEVNDLSKGRYNYICSSGPAFYNRQQETVKAINEIAQIDPSIMQEGGDVYLSNIPSPGMDKLAKRRRSRMLAQGLIPTDEMSETEKQETIKKNEEDKNKPPSAMDQALIAEAQARTKEVAAKTEDTLSKVDERNKKFLLDVQKFNEKTELDKKKSQQEDKRLMLEALAKQDMQLKLMADTLVAIRTAIGVDTIVAPIAAGAFEMQSNKLLDAIQTAT